MGFDGTVELIPFGSVVGKKCADVFFGSARPGFPAECNEGPVKANNPEIEEKTDLIPVFAAIEERSSAAVTVGRRRIFVIFSDFVHHTERLRQDSRDSWRGSYLDVLDRVSDNIKSIRGQSIVFFMLRNEGANVPAEIAEIASVIRENFRVAEGQDVEERRNVVLREIQSDPTPLKVRVTKVGFQKVSIEIENPSCVERRDLRYKIRPTDGPEKEIEIRSLSSDPEACPNDLRQEKKECSLSLPARLLSRRNCCPYVLRVVPNIGSRAAARSDRFELDNCFKVQSVDLDTANNVEGAAYLKRCFDPREREKWKTWQASDFESKENSGDEEFVACVRARGSLNGHSGKFELTLGDGGFAKVDPVSMERFMGDSPPDGDRFFPVFFRLRRDDARRMCYRPHEEAPPNMRLHYSIARQEEPGVPVPKPIDGDLNLVRSRDREAEERLHDLWESIAIPVVVILAVVILVVWSSRRISTGAIEENLAIFGLGFAAVTAALHDATSLGDWVEELFARWPVWFTVIALLLLGLVFFWLEGLGVFEPRRSPVAALRETELARLKEREALFKRRFKTWWITITSLVVLGILMLSLFPKEIDVCHYTYTNTGRD